MKKNQFLRRQAAERIQHRTSEELKGHHGGDRISWETEEILVALILRAIFAGRGTRAAGNPAEYNRASWLDLRAGEEEFSLELRQHPLNQVVFAHRYSASEQQQVGLKSVSDQLAKAGRLIGCD